MPRLTELRPPSPRLKGPNNATGQRCGAADIGDGLARIWSCLGIAIMTRSGLHQSTFDETLEYREQLANVCVSRIAQMTTRPSPRPTGGVRSLKLASLWGSLRRVWPHLHGLRELDRGWSWQIHDAHQPAQHESIR